MFRGLKAEGWRLRGILVIFSSRVIKPIMLTAPVVHRERGGQERLSRQEDWSYSY